MAVKKSKADSIPISIYTGYEDGGLERPCPFCGSKYIYVTPVAIYCNICGCKVSSMYYNGEEISAKDVWNGVLNEKRKLFQR